MLASLTELADELRRAGLPVSLTESLDAAAALSALPLEHRDDVRAALAATLVKSAAHLPVFETLFDVYFPATVGAGSGPAVEPIGMDAGTDAGPSSSGGAGAGTGEGDGVGLEPGQLAGLVAEALAGGDLRQLCLAAALAVQALAGIEASRPVGVAYYLARTLRQLDLETTLDGLVQAVLARPVDEAPPPGAPRRPPGPLGERLVREEYARRARSLVAAIEAEILRRLVEDRGAAAVAGTVRRPLAEDVDVMHASREQLAELRRALGPLARVLAARLARRRRHHRRGPLDFRHTLRASLSAGGVPIEPKFRSPHPSKPELVVLADISGSVAAFARFTLHLLYALDAQFAKVRSFVFIDEIDEVTGILRAAASLPEAVARMASEANVAGGDGHSDYGRALVAFRSRYADAVGPRSNLLVLGDARNNYHPAEAGVLEELHRRARRVYWLNPEPRAYWGSGDSIVSSYAPFCDGVVECRTLRQLEAFVDALA